MLAALKLQEPDCVPVAPDISNMIPCRLTGKDFRDIYIREEPPLWKAYIDSASYFGMDAWAFGYLGDSEADRRELRYEIMAEDDERTIRRCHMTTPEGETWSETVYYRDQPPTQIHCFIKDFERDFKFVKYLYPDPSTCDLAPFLEQQAYCGNSGIIGPIITYQPFPIWLIEGGHQAAIMACFDQPGLIARWVEMYHEWAVKKTRRALEAKPDFILTGFSGTLSLGSPDMFRRNALPTLQAITSIAKEAGVPTILHSCGLEKLLVEICSNETELTCINPLEPPPMGDCDLREIKRKYGQRLCLMGNLHTTEVMLLGTADDVEKAAKQAIDDAAAGGGFILSTGDQCGRDTTLENIFRMVQVARTYGRYR